MPFARHPGPQHAPALDRVAATLGPVLAPLGFGPAQAGASDGRGQVIFCRGEADSSDGGCVDVVVDLEAMPDWRITEVRYWGRPSERWHLTVADGDLDAQLAALVLTLPDELS